MPRIAPIAQWIELLRPKERILVRFRVRAQTRQKSLPCGRDFEFVNRSDVAVPFLGTKTARLGRKHLLDLEPKANKYS